MEKGEKLGIQEAILTSKSKIHIHPKISFSCIVVLVLSNQHICIFSVPLDGDQGTALKDLVHVPIGPITRAQAKKFKDVLNGLIQELWAQANSRRPIEHDPRGQQKIITLIQVLEGSDQDRRAHV